MEQGIFGTWNKVYLEHGTRYIWNMEQGISGTWDKVNLEHGTGYIWNRKQGFTDIASNDLGSNDKRSNTRQRVKRRRVKNYDKRAKFHLDNFWFTFKLFLCSLELVAAVLGPLVMSSPQRSAQKLS